jgi:hypothetical protein
MRLGFHNVDLYVDAIFSSEMLVSMYHAKWYSNQEDRNRSKAFTQISRSCVNAICIVIFAIEWCKYENSAGIISSNVTTADNVHLYNWML